MSTILTKSKQWMRVLLIGVALISLPALAIDLDSAKAQGLVRETATGYLAVVKPSPEVNSLVNRINAGRKEEYRKIAEKRGTPLSAVEQLAGQKLMKK
jgi:uncharacterized protein YdbL (DUF1318 family)